MVTVSASPPEYIDHAGMSRILCCTRALAKQMMDPQHQWDERLPRTFEISSERIKRALEAPPIKLAGQGLPTSEVDQ